ncbi:recombinase family protein [Streptomyces sp. NPDC091377]|uniref:recombinase family protein n=1 Tax=Streptomyces sp. NPDC091377 TaxID=3365995 RepID=UPI0037F7E599
MTPTALLESATETALKAGPVADRPLRAVIYARVSQDPNEELRSVSQQIEECMAECDRNGWNIVRVFQDNDRSASRYATKDRPRYRELIEFIKGGHVDVLVTWESSRAQRDLEAYVRLRKVAEDSGVLWSYKGRLYDLSRTDDRFTTGLDALLDERESSVTRDRIMRDMTANAVKGRPHGKNVYGYRRIYHPETKALIRQEVKKDQAAVVREAVRRVAAGDSLRSIAIEFNRRAIPTPGSAKEWKGYGVRSLVLNVAYVGKRSHRGRVVADAVWPPILEGQDEEAFYACAQILSDPRRRVSKDTRIKHLLTGRLSHCGKCGGQMRRKSCGTQRTPVYQCADHFCTSIVASRFEDYVTTVVCERLARPDATDLLGDDSRAEEAKAAMAEAAEKRSRLDEFYDAAATGEVSPVALARIEARLLPEIESAEKRAADLRVPALLRNVIRPDIADVWPTLPITRQRAVIDALMSVRVLPLASGGRWSLDNSTRRIEITWKQEKNITE